MREGDGPWKPGPGIRIFVVDSGVLPMIGIAPGGAMTVDLSKFWEAARKHRKPKPENVERDSKIRELWNNGNKTEGQILLLLKHDYPKLTHYAVKSVLRRFRDAGMLAPHRRK